MTDLREQIQKVTSDEPVSLFMKGTPELVMCGNPSARSMRSGRPALP